MQIQLLEIEEFLIRFRKSNNAFLLDTRSSNEYAKAHIPGALSLPLLDNESRAIIGTIYKQQGREAAVIKGFELEGPRFYEKIQKAILIAPSKEVYLYCWRGGMRSNIMAWLLQMAGFKVTLLKGGYKTFRHWVLKSFEGNYNFVVLGGMTGSGKTDLLLKLKEEKQQVIDLEAIANHRGSAFGGLGKGAQPSQEHFENLLATQLYPLNANEQIWIENESRRIGSILLPNRIFEKICSALLIEISVPLEKRKSIILKEYGAFPVDQLIEKTKQVEKRMGPQNVKAAVTALQNDDYSLWLDYILDYYDRSYGKNQKPSTNCEVRKVNITMDDVNVDVFKVLNYAKK